MKALLLLTFIEKCLDFNPLLKENFLLLESNFMMDNFF
jgi:hypothetical protein